MRKSNPQISWSHEMRLYLTQGETQMPCNNKEARKTQTQQTATTTNHRKLEQQLIFHSLDWEQSYCKSISGSWRMSQNSARYCICYCMCTPHLPESCVLEMSLKPQDSKEVAGQIWSQWDLVLRLRRRMRMESILPTAGGRQQVKTADISFQPYYCSMQLTVSSPTLSPPVSSL